MLEKPALILGPWMSCPPTRGITEAASGQPLGSVRRVPAAGWWFWPGRERLEVLETEDEALLCTLVRPGRFRRAWSFFDAEDQCLGRWQEGELFDGARAWLARLECTEGGGRFVDRQGICLAALAPRGDGAWNLEFAETVKSPFTRMALLGSALAWFETDK